MSKYGVKGRMNNYFTSGVGHYSITNNYVFTGKTDTLESGGKANVTQENWNTLSVWDPYDETIKLLSDDAVLTVGGIGAGNNSFVYNATNLQQAGTVIKFDGNGFVNFTAHTGGAVSGTNAEDANSVIKDTDITIVGSNIYSASSPVSGSQDLLRASQDATITGISAAKLNFISDMAATVDVTSKIVIQGSRIPQTGSDGKDATSYIEKGSSNTASAVAVNASTVDFANNFTGKLLAKSDASTFKGYIAPSVSSNKISAYGVKTAGAATLSNGYWGGEITVSAAGNQFLGDKGELLKNEDKTNKATAGVSSNTVDVMGVTAASLTVKEQNGKVNANADSNVFKSVADGNKTTTSESNGSTTTTESVSASSASVSGNKVSAVGINATGAAEIGKLDAQITASAKNNKFTASASSKPVASSGSGSSSSSETSTTASVSGNSVTVYGINAGNLTVGELGGKISASADGIEFKATGENATNRTVTVSGNTVNVAAINASSLTVAGDFTADLATSLKGYTAAQSGNNAKLTYPVSGNTSNVYGINLGSGSLTVNGNMAGSVDLQMDDSWSSILFNDIAANNKYNLFAVQAGTITVNGYLASNITTNTMVDSVKLVGIAAGKITAKAFTGSVKSNIAITVTRNMTNTDDGIFDFAGSANGWMIGIHGFAAGMNLRISGSVTSEEVFGYGGYAIVAGTMTASGLLTHHNTNDYLEIAAGASVTGSIELANGENTLIVDSNARVEGSLQSTAGKLNLTFMLNDKAMDSAANETAADDTTFTMTSGQALTSTASVSINLNDVVLDGAGKTYYIANDNQSGWGSRQIAFVYQDYTKWAKVGESVEVKDSNDNVIFKASSKFENGVFSVTVDELAELDETYAAPVVDSLIDKAGDSVKFNWAAVENVDKYEVEYIIDNGKSITVMLDGDITSYTFDDIGDNQKVAYRVRAHYSAHRSFTDWSETTVVDMQNAPGFDVVTPVAESTEDGSLELEWTAITGAQNYELVYTVDGEEYTEIVDGSQNNFIIEALAHGSKVDYKVRAVLGEDKFSVWTQDSVVTDFSGEEVDYYNVKEVKLSVENPEVSGTTTSSAVVTLNWEGFKCEKGLKRYEIRYFSSSDEVLDVDWDSFEYGVTPNYYHKYTTADELIVTGLNDSEYLYWQVRCEDNEGNKSDWVSIDPLMMIKDDIAPNMGEVVDTVVFNIDKNPEDVGFVTNSLTWNNAADNAGGTGVRDYTIQYREKGTEKWTEVVLDNRNKSYTVDLNNVDYEWKVMAYDYADNASKEVSGTWYGDNIAIDTATLTAGNGGYKVGKDYCDVVVNLDWEAVADVDNNDSPGSGVKGYIVSYYDETSSEWVEVAKVSGTTCKYTYRLPNGNYQWKVQSYDYAMNVSTGKLVTSYGDSTAPVFSSDKTVWSAIWDSSSKKLVVSGSWEKAADAASGLKGYRVVYKNVKTGAEGEQWFSAAATSGKFSIANGEYEWKLQAVDYAGNAVSIGGSDNWKGDLVAPTFADKSYLYSNINRNSSGKAASVDFEWSIANDPAGFNSTGISHYVLTVQTDKDGDGVLDTVVTQKVNGQKNTHTTIKAASGKIDPAKDGKYTWFVDAYDFGGNKATSSSGSFIIDNTAPEGAFGSSSSADVDCAWSTYYKVDDNGKTETFDYVSDVTITCKFNSNHTDSVSKVLYEVQICADDTFSGSTLKSFITDTTELIFDGGNGESNGHICAGELQGMKKFYWRVRATNDNGNAADVWHLGNAGKAVSLYDQNHRNEDGAAMLITDKMAPTLSGSASIKSNNAGGTVISWSRANDAFGIKEYRLKLTRKGGFDKTVSIKEYNSVNADYSNVASIAKSGSTYTITTDKGNNQVVINGLPDGVYTVQVNAVDFAGKSSGFKTLGSSIVVDTTAPVLDLKSVKATVAVNDVMFSWKAASDAVGVSHYKLIYKKMNEKGDYVTVQSITVAGDATKYQLNNLSIGKYCFSLQAFDAKGHASDVFGWVYDESNVTKESIFLIENKDAGNSFGSASKVTLGKVYYDSVNYSDTVDYYELKMTGNGMASINVKDVISLGNGKGGVKVTLYNASGKKVKNLKVASGSKSLDVLLQTGKYYIGVSPAKKKTSVQYAISTTVDYFPAATTNDNADKFKSGKLSTTKLVNSGSKASLTCSGWVGYGDAEDYIAVSGSRSAYTSIKVSGISAKTKVVIYDENMKKVKSYSLKSGKDLFSGYLGGKYYISIASGDKGKGKQNSDYKFSINSSYVAADVTANDSFAQADKNKSVLTAANKLTGWVGKGDVADYYRFTSASAERLAIKVSGVQGKMKLTVYDRNQKKVKSVSISKDGTYLKNLLVDGDFYIQVASADKGKKQNSNYNINVQAEIFPVEAKANNSIAQAADLTKTGVSGVVNGWDGAEALVDDWVGFGDKSDFFAFELSDGGKVDFDLKLDDASLKAGKAVKVKLFNAAGKSLSLDKELISKNELEAGKYFVSVETSNEKKNMTGYKLDISIC